MDLRVSRLWWKGRNSRWVAVRHPIREKMMSGHVRVEKGGGVLAITLARPERRNAITVAMYAALAAAIAGAFDDGQTRLITIRGEGQDFAAGGELAGFFGLGPRGGGDPGWGGLPGRCR